MRGKKNQQPERAAVGPGKSTREVGPATDASTGEKRGTIASQTKTTRRLDRAIKRDADDRMAGKQKAIARWEGEGGAIPPAKKSRKKGGEK